MGRTARTDESYEIARSTKDTRQAWIENGCPIRPTDDHVVVARLNEKDLGGSTKLEIVTHAGHAKRQERKPLKWSEIIGQVVAIGPGERSQVAPFDRVPIDGLSVGDYVGTMNDLGGLFFADFQETGVDVIVAPAEAMRCVVDMPGAP